MTKAGPINQPICVSLRFRSRLIGATSRETIWRSSMLIISARANTNTAYQARVRLGQGSLAPSGATIVSDGKSAEILVASVLIRCPPDNKFLVVTAQPGIESMKRDYGTNGNNGTNERIWSRFFRLFRYFRLFRNLFFMLSDEIFIPKPSLL